MVKYLETIIAAVSPGWAAKRARSRHVMTAYAAAEKTRLTKDFREAPESADQAIVDSTPVLNARARAMVQNNWSACSIVSAYRRHVVGRGITSRATATNPDTGEPLTKFNEAIDMLWDRWARDRLRCDVEGRKTFHEMQSLGISEWATVGQSFMVESYVPNPNTVGLQLQIFETEQLAWDMFRFRRSGAAAIKGGIELDEVGRPIAYWFHTGEHPMESFGNDPVRIPADRVRHLFRQDRALQTHGVTKMAAVLIKMHHLSNYDLNQIVKARMEACIGAAITKSPDLGSGSPLGTTPPAGDTDHPVDARGDVRHLFQPGMVLELEPHEEIEFNNPTGPGGAYAPFTSQQLIEIAAGADLDYPTVARDFAKGTFSSQRQSLIERNAATDPLQGLEIDLWCRPTRARFTTFAILERKIQAPNFLTDPRWAESYLETVWQGPPKPWIDPLKQAQASILTLAARLGTRRDMLNELGTNEGDVFRQIAAEEALAKKLGIKLPEASGSTTTAPVDTTNDDGEEVDDEDTQMEEVVLAAASQILESRGGNLALGRNGQGGAL